MLDMTSEIFGATYATFEAAKCANPSSPFDHFFLLSSTQILCGSGEKKGIIRLVGKRQIHNS